MLSYYEYYCYRINTVIQQYSTAVFYHCNVVNGTTNVIIINTTITAIDNTFRISANY